VKHCAEPAVSGVATTAATAQRLPRMPDLLPSVAEYGGRAGRVFRRLRVQAVEATARVRRHRAAWHRTAPLRPVLAAVVPGVGYVTYSLSRGSGHVTLQASHRRRAALAHGWALRDGGERWCSCGIM
jgi:hypothetical protein